MQAHESRQAVLAGDDKAPVGLRRMPAHLRWTRTKVAPKVGARCSTYLCGAAATVMLTKPSSTRRRTACDSCAGFLTGERERAG